jgi:drug/metabolite transporter (DMT)-like permease
MWIVLAGIALCSVAAQLFLTRAYASAQAAHVGPFVYSTVVFATLAAWLFWNEIPDAISVLGIVIVCVAGILAIRRGAAPVEPLPDRVPQR